MSRVPGPVSIHFPVPWYPAITFFRRRGAVTKWISAAITRFYQGSIRRNTGSWWISDDDFAHHLPLGLFDWYVRLMFVLSRDGYLLVYSLLISTHAIIFSHILTMHVYTILYSQWKRFLLLTSFDQFGTFHPFPSVSIRHTSPSFRDQCASPSAVLGCPNAKFDFNSSHNWN